MGGWAGIVSRIRNYHGFKEPKTKTPKQLTYMEAIFIFIYHNQRKYLLIDSGPVNMKGGRQVEKFLIGFTCSNFGPCGAKVEKDQNGIKRMEGDKTKMLFGPFFSLYWRFTITF